MLNLKQLKKKLSDNLSLIRREIASACQLANRDPADVMLIAVTKSVGLDVIHTLVELGQFELAENRPQELVKRAAMLEEQKLRGASIKRSLKLRFLFYKFKIIC